MENNNQELMPIQTETNNTVTKSTNTSVQKPEVNQMTFEEQAKHYKDLFTRSKKLIIHYEENIKTKDQSIKSLKDKLKEYEAENGKTCEILFQFKYENIIFYFFKSENSYYFVNEKILDENFRNEINQNESIKSYDYNRDLKSRDDTISQIILQYEDKMRRLSEENEKNEKKIINLNDKIKKITKEMDDLRTNYENDKKQFEDSIRKIIGSSSETLYQMKNILEIDLSDDSLQEEVYDKVKESIENINQIEDISKSKWLAELKTYTSKTLISYLDTIFKLVNLDKVFLNQKLKWQTTLDQISLSHDEEMKKSKINFILGLMIIDTHKMHINNLNQKISNLEQEKYNIAKQKDHSIEILSKELNKGVNINYLRSVFVSFLTSKEESVFIIFYFRFKIVYSLLFLPLYNLMI